MNIHERRANPCLASWAKAPTSSRIGDASDSFWVETCKRNSSGRSWRMLRLVEDPCGPCRPYRRWSSCLCPPRESADVNAGDIGFDHLGGRVLVWDREGPLQGAMGSSHKPGIAPSESSSSHNATGNTGGSSSTSSPGAAPPCTYTRSPLRAIRPPWVPPDILAREVVLGGMSGRGRALQGRTGLGSRRRRLPNPAQLHPFQRWIRLVLAQQAENSMRLPSPQIETNPSTQAIVNLPTWLWLDQGTWNPESVSASVGTVTATATATPEQVQWTMG